MRSVSGDPALRPNVIDMGCWLKKQLDDLGVSTQRVDLGLQDGQSEGEEPLQLPYVILGRVGEDPAKRTVLVYGHYDVQPVRLSLSYTHIACVGADTSGHRRSRATGGTPTLGSSTRTTTLDA